MCLCGGPIKNSTKTNQDKSGQNPKNKKALMRKLILQPRLIYQTPILNEHFNEYF
jgi:hypothetical protein